MKYAAISSLISVLFLLSNTVVADTIVDCNRPPGGQIRCPDTLAAICSIRSGAVYGLCLPPPKSSSLSDRREFFISIVGEENNTNLLQVFRDEDIRQAIASGEFKSPVDGSIIRFNLPGE